MQPVGVSPDHVPLFLLCKIIKKKGIFSNRSTAAQMTDDLESCLVFSFFFFSFFGWVKRTKKKERNKKRENGQMTTAIVGTTIWRNNSIAGWTAIRILFFSSSIFFFYPSRPVLCVVCVCSSSSTSLRMISDALATPRLDASVRMEGTQSPPDGWVPYTVNHI